MAQPLLHWTPSIAPPGMAFYTADKFPGWQGDLFVGALAGKHLRRAHWGSDQGPGSIAQKATGPHSGRCPGTRWFFVYPHGR